MPKIEVNRSDLLSLARMDDPGDKALAELLARVKGEIDSSAGDLLKIELNDTNRPDLWSVEGIARALRCAESGAESHLSGLPAPVDRIIVGGELSKIRPYIAAFTATGWAPDGCEFESLMQTQEKLAVSFGKNRKTAAIGFYRLGGIRFPLKYLGASPDELFRPLGEDRRMTLMEVLDLTEAGRKYGHLVEHAAKWPLLRDATGTILSFPPIINSDDAGRVTPGDSRLFCEVTGTDRETVQLAATILACNLEDRGAVISPVRIIYPFDVSSSDGRDILTPVIFKDVMEATTGFISGMLGVDISPAVVREALGKMDYASVETAGEKVFGVLPPYRRDGMHAVDMVEDIAVAMGLESFEPLLPREFTIGRSAGVEDLADEVRILLVGAGCEEVMRPVLSASRKISNLSRTPAPPVAIANPMTGEYGVVRNTLLPGLLEVESLSAHAAYPHRLFEIGEALVSGEGETCATELLLGCLVSGNRADFGDIHSLAGFLCLERGLELLLQPCEDSRFIPGRCAAALIEGRRSGVIGEFQPAVLTAWGIARPAAGLEVRLDCLGR